MNMYSVNLCIQNKYRGIIGTTMYNIYLSGLSYYIKFIKVAAV